MVLLTDPIVGLAAQTRIYLLFGFIILMFAIAGLAVVIGRRGRERKQAAALSFDTGTSGGADQGGDTTLASDWLAETTSEHDSSEQRQSWQDAYLSGSSLLDDTTPATQPEPATEPEPGPATEDVWSSESYDASAAPAATSSLAAPADAWAPQTVEEPEPVWSSEPESTWNPDAEVAPATDYATLNEISEDFDTSAQTATDPAPAPDGRRRNSVPDMPPLEGTGYVGKRRAQPFTVDNYLDDTTP